MTVLQETIIAGGGCSRSLIQQAHKILNERFTSGECTWGVLNPYVGGLNAFAHLDSEWDAVREYTGKVGALHSKAWTTEKERNRT